MKIAEAKVSEGGTTENERKYSILGSIRRIVNNRICPAVDNKFLQLASKSGAS